MATDHCPFQSYEKDWGKDDFTKIPNGCAGIENLYPYMLDAANSGKITFERAVELCSTNPAKIFGCDDKGAIEVGKDADIVIYDKDKDFTVSVNNMHSDCDHTIWEGKKLHGYPAFRLIFAAILFMITENSRNTRKRKICKEKYLKIVLKAVDVMGYREVVLKTESSRCLLCENAPCAQACTYGVKIDQIIRSVNFDNEQGARYMLADNPCVDCIDGGCMQACSRAKFDLPVRIDKITELLSQQNPVSVPDIDLTTYLCGVKCENPFSFHHLLSAATMIWLQRRLIAVGQE